MRKNAILGNLNSLALGTVGFIAAKQLDRVEFIQNNPLVGSAVKIGIGLFLSAGRNKMFQPAGMGMAVAGATQLVSNVIGGAGLSGLPYGSLDVASVSGSGMLLNIN
ncbi:MAG: hypothetical protein K9I85_06055 [Saprospiraceae bacterium]|nr:hypothetical protein [Saprospiraceae bacterium]